MLLASLVEPSFGLIFWMTLSFNRVVSQRNLITNSWCNVETELRRRFPDKTLVIASISADWGASYLPPRELYDTGVYQESIAVVAAGSLEQLIKAIARRIES